MDTRQSELDFQNEFWCVREVSVSELEETLNQLSATGWSILEIRDRTSSLGHLATTIGLVTAGGGPWRRFERSVTKEFVVIASRSTRAARTLVWEGWFVEESDSPEDGGQARLADLEGDGSVDWILRPRFVSWDEGTERTHTDFKSLKGKRVQIKLEVIGEVDK